MARKKHCGNIVLKHLSFYVFIYSVKGILQTAIIVAEDSSVTQLCYTEDSLLISTLKRTVIWSFQTETIVQVGEKERKT